MKLIHSIALLGAFSTIAAQGAYTDPVGFYDVAGKAGGNLVVPSLVEAAAFSGAITASTSTTMTVGAGAFTGGAFDAGVSFPTHYVEIASGPNTGVAVDITSNTDSVLTLSDDISALSLVGTESIVVRPHVTLKGALSGGEASFAGFSDSATFYTSGGIVTYFWTGTDWSTDFSTPDGNLRPVSPGTGFVLTLAADVTFSVTGEVKTTPTVVQLLGGVVNIVGPVNPLVGDSDPIKDLGFADLLAFTDSVTLYTPGALTITGTYFALGDGNVSTDFSTPSLDEFPFTKGGVVTASADDAITIPAPTIAP